VKDLVASLCALRPWRAEELALLLQRNTEYVRQNYLRPMLKEERIAMTNPQDLNDPNQAYIAVPTAQRG
jgi:ATP-dependent DNA helicase RecG